MAAVQPRVAPRRHPAPPQATPSQASAARSPQLLPCKRGRADAVAAVAHGRKQERVAESCSPSERELVLIDDDSGDEEGGCGSCVVGGGSGGGYDGDEKEEAEESGSVVVWWRREIGTSSSRCSIWADGSRARASGDELRAGGERDDEDPKVAAARRQEEDRKFWEACLASGYP